MRFSTNLILLVVIFVECSCASVEMGLMKPPPYHIAMVTGCDSHISVTKPITHTLLNKTSQPGKYRVTYVTGSQCRKVPEKLGARFHDTGVWYWPNYDPNVSTMEYYTNVSIGSVLSSYEGLKSLLATDPYDLIIAEGFSAGASIISEKYDIPLAYAHTPGTPHFAMYLDPPSVNNMWMVPFYTPTESLEVPDFVLSFLSTMLFAVTNILSSVFCRAGELELNRIRSEMGLPLFDSYMHLSNSFPNLAMIGKPITEMRDMPPYLAVTGLLPPAPEVYPVPERLQRFLDKSDRPILYVSLGTYFAYSDETLAQVKTALEKQDKFNVVWSHKHYDPDKFPVLEPSRMIVMNSVPQKHVLAHEKTKVFLTHCGMSSIIEGVSSSVAFLTSPQGRDQFYLADMLIKAHLSLDLGQFPKIDDVIQKIDKLHGGLDWYISNTKEVYKELRIGSEKKLEEFVDKWASFGHTTRFDLDESNLLSTKQSYLIVAAVLLTHLVLLMVAAHTIRTIVRVLGKSSKETASQKKTM